MAGRNKLPVDRTFGLAAVSLVSCSSGHMASHDHGGANAPLAQAVRRATERFQDVTAATAAGYALFLGCVSSPQGGPMGPRVSCAEHKAGVATHTAAAHDARR